MRVQRCLPLIAPLSLQLPLASSSALEPLRFITAHKAERGLHRGAAPPVGDSPGKLTDSFTVHTSQKQRKTFHPHLRLPQREEKGLETALARISSRGMENGFI